MSEQAEHSADSLSSLAEERASKQLRQSVTRSAMDALARREYSVFELSNKLQAKFDDAGLVNGVVTQLRQDNLLNDQRFAEALCRSRYRKGYGPVRIEQELHQHQISADLVSAAMADYQDLWLDQLQALKERKYGKVPASDYKTWAKQARFLQSRGFTTAQIQAVLERLTS